MVDLIAQKYKPRPTKRPVQGPGRYFLAQLGYLTLTVHMTRRTVTSNPSGIINDI